VGEAFFALAVP